MKRFLFQPYGKALVVGLALSGTLAVAQATPSGSTLPAPIVQAIGEIAAGLNLSPAQQAQFAIALAKTEQTVPQIRANHLALANAAKAELQNPVPDLAALANRKDATELANLGLRQIARAEWLKLYAMLSPGQVEALKPTLNAAMARIENAGSQFGLLPHP